jgi:hypothetical protein
VGPSPPVGRSSPEPRAAEGARERGAVGGADAAGPVPTRPRNKHVTMISRIENVLAGSFAPASPRVRRLATVCFISGSALVAVVVLAIGEPMITRFPSDTVFMLTQSDYLVRGSRPHVDYHSLYSIFPYVFTALGMALHGVSLKALVLGRLIAALCLGGCLYKIAGSRLHAGWALLLALAAESLLVGLTPIGYAVWREYTFAMWYNSVGYVIETGVFLYTFLPSASPSTVSRRVDSLLAGMLLCALFYTKLSFFAPLLVVFLVGVVIVPREAGQRRGLTLVLAGAIGLHLLLAAGTGVSASSYLSFAAGFPMRVNPIYLLFRYLQYSQVLLIWLVAMLVVARMAWGLGCVRPMLREWGLALLMTGALAVSVSTANQNQELIPFIGVLPLAACTMLYRLSRPKTPDAAMAAVVAALVLALDVHVPKNAVLSVPFSRVSVPMFSKAVSFGDVPDGDSREALSDRVDRELFTRMPEAFTHRVEDALRLLGQNGARPGEGLFVAEAVDVVTVFTDLRYARGGTPWWEFGLVEAPEAYPPPDPEFLSDTKWILRPRRDGACWRFLDWHRGPYLGANFEQRAQNATWLLYERVPVKVTRRDRMG